MLDPSDHDVGMDTSAFRQHVLALRWQIVRAVTPSVPDRSRVDVPPPFRGVLQGSLNRGRKSHRVKLCASMWEGSLGNYAAAHRAGVIGDGIHPSMSILRFKQLSLMQLSLTVLRTISPEASASSRVSDGMYEIYFAPCALDALEAVRDEDPTVDLPAGHLSTRFVDTSADCHYCGNPSSSIDHVTPRTLGGRDRWWNRVQSCYPCNSRKGNVRGSCDCDFCQRAHQMWLAGYRDF